MNDRIIGLTLDATAVPMLRIVPPENPEGWINLWWDGSLEHGPAYKPDAAAAIFWNEVSALAQQVARHPEIPGLHQPPTT